jgi:hypothetical protein
MRFLAISLIAAVLLTHSTARAQDTVTPSASGRTPAFGDPATIEREPVNPASPVQLIRPAQLAHPTHKFLDIKNSLAIAAFGASLAADSYSTQRGLAYPSLRELNPVARPFVSSRPGEIAYSGASFALFGGGMYLAHRTGHHKLERVAPWVIAGWEGLLAGWNWHEVALERAGR